MPAELKSRLSLDILPFQSGLKAAEQGADRLAATVASRFKGLAAPLTGFGAGVAAAFTGNAIASGVTDILKAGGALVDLSDQTGVSVRNLVILEKRFTDAGLSAEDAAAAIGKMQKYLQEVSGDSGKQGRLHELDLSVRELMSMKPEKQLEAIGKAVAGVSSPTERTAASMEIFGKSGAKLLRVFQGDIFANVGAGLEKRAAFMQRNAKAFDELSDKLMGPSGIAKTFYAGIAEGVTPALSSVVDALKKINLVEEGKQFGNSLVRGATALLEAAKFVKDSGIIQNTVGVIKGVANTGVVQAGVNLGSQALGGAAHILQNGVTADQREYTTRGFFGRNLRPDGSRMTLQEMRDRDAAAAAGNSSTTNMDGSVTTVSSARDLLHPDVRKRLDAKAGGSRRASPPVIDPRNRAPLAIPKQRTQSLESWQNDIEHGYEPPPWADVGVQKYFGMPDMTGRPGQFEGRPMNASFADKLKPTLQGALTPNMADRLKANGVFGQSATGLNVDTAEDSRQRRKKLMEDARFTNPNATPAQLNATVDGQLRAEKDQQKAQAYRDSVTGNQGGNKPASGDSGKDPLVDALASAFETALENVLGERLDNQTEKLGEMNWE